MRELSAELLSREAALFPIRTAYWYVPRNVVGDPGHNDYQADNPPFGAVFTYHLRDGYQSMEEERKALERAVAAEEDVPFTDWDALEAEMREQGPAVRVVVRDESGSVFNRVDGPTSAGLHRVSWNLRHSPQNLIGLGSSGGGSGLWALPGSYTATLIKVEEGQTTELTGPVRFELVPLREGALPRPSDQVVASFRDAVVAFQHDFARTENLLDESLQKVEALQTALERAEDDDPGLASRLYDVRLELLELREALSGSEAKDEIGERDPPSPGNRLSVASRGLTTTYGPTELHRSMVEAGRNELAEIQVEVERLAEQVIPELERAVEATGAPPIEGGTAGA